MWSCVGRFSHERFDGPGSVSYEPLEHAWVERLALVAVFKRLLDARERLLEKMVKAELAGSETGSYSQAALLNPTVFPSNGAHRTQLPLKALGYSLHTGSQFGGRAGLRKESDLTDFPFRLATFALVAWEENSRPGNESFQADLPPTGSDRPRRPTKVENEEGPAGAGPVYHLDLRRGDYRWKTKPNVTRTLF